MVGPKAYGGRWVILPGPPLGSGGQSQVFRAKDESGVLQGEFALKRVINAKRHERFRREIEATKKLDHENIIKLVDHSALDEGADDDRQFLVMPIAAGGDLTRRDRLSSFEGALDPVVQVAKQIAAALSAAHSKGIIHRDVKPANVLFTGMGTQIWLTDFGICLIREEPRITELPEAVGPRSFMAPELEDGGHLEVTPAADVYSFGKLIYFMISGGRLLPRERLSDAQYRKPFKNGERYHLLELLLNRMVCLLPQRIKTIAEAAVELDKISEWERTAHTLPISSSTLSALEQLQRRSLESARAIAGNAAARDQESRSLESIRKTFAAWAYSQLELAAAAIATETLTCEVRDAKIDLNLVKTGQNSGYRPLAGAEFELQDKVREPTRKHIFQALICDHHRTIVTTNVETGSATGRTSVVQVQPARDHDLAVIFVYKYSVTNRTNEQPLEQALLTTKAHVGVVHTFTSAPTVYRQTPRPSGLPRRAQLKGVTSQFEPALSLYRNFKASDWPANESDVRSSLQEGIDVFIEYITSRL